MLNVGIIYRVVSPSGKSYIGQTTRTLRQRKNQHYRDAFKEKSNSKFSSAIRKYKDSLKWEILEESISKNLLNEKEREYVAKFDSYFNGYNCTPGGNQPGEFSKDTVERMIKAKLRGASHPFFGKPRSEETKRKISEANKGMKYPEEVRKKRSERLRGIKPICNFFGKKHSEETKKRISETHLGKSLSENVKHKISESKKGTQSGENNPFFGKKHSEDTKKKISENSKNRNAYAALKRFKEDIYNIQMQHSFSYKQAKEWYKMEKIKC